MLIGRHRLVESAGGRERVPEFEVSPRIAGRLRHGVGPQRQAVRRMRERSRFMKGLYAWVGFKVIGVPFEIKERAHGQSTFNYTSLLSFAFDGITSFSTLPLKIWIFIGAIISFLAFLTGMIYIIRTMTLGVDVPGYASLIVSIMFFSGIQLLSLGVLGEYIGRIFAEVKRRPLYLIGQRFGIDDPDDSVTPPPLNHQQK